MKISACLFALAPLILANTALAQQFAPQVDIDPSTPTAMGAFVGDLNRDGLPDVAASYWGTSEVAWYEAQSPGQWSTRQVISTSYSQCRSMSGGDWDADGDLDLIAGDNGCYATLENLGAGTFGPHTRLQPAAYGFDCDVLDFDQDGDLDILGSSVGSVRYSEGTPTGFKTAITVCSGLPGNVYFVAAHDFDGDGDLDVFTNSSGDPATAEVNYTENLGSGNFSPPTVFYKDGANMATLASCDIDNDGLNDLVLSTGTIGVVWWRQSSLGKYDALAPLLPPNTVQLAFRDLDGDGLKDAVTAGGIDQWYRNQGGGQFALPAYLGTGGSSYGPGGGSLALEDMDGDGDIDIARCGTASIVWYENLINEADCNGNGVPDPNDIANGTSADCDKNGVPDECQITDDPSLDQDGNGVLDSCQCAFSNFCVSTGNSTGVPATIGWSGSASITAADLTLTGNNLPPFQFGMFFYGSDDWFPVVMGDGLLCIAPPLYRIRSVVISDSTGVASLTLDYGSKPLSSGKGQVAAFSTWRFQLWYRDPTGGPAGSNTTDGLMVTFCP